MNLRKKMIMMANINKESLCDNYLTIEALEDGLTAKLSTNACQYSTDAVAWTDLAADTETPAINTGEKLYFKATGLTPTSSNGIGTFTVSKQFNLSGNCMSMLFGDEAESNLDLTGYNYAFYKLFYNCTTLKSVSDGFLPATTLKSECYRYMFQNCSILTTAPELPATTLASACYYGMFYGCNGLTTAPELPATTLANYCYDSMFYGCSNLTTAPELPVTTLVDYCYYAMFKDCTGLTTAPELPATTMASHCYSYMFSGCSSLTAAPKLSAMTLANECYYAMFKDCTGLTTAPELPATTLAKGCYSAMFKGCTGLTTAPELPATKLANYCYDSMFYGTNVLPDCTNINFSSSTVVQSGGLRGLFAGTKVTDSDLRTILPINPKYGYYWLPVTTLADYCYVSMFRNCIGLTTAPVLPATTMASQCYSYMFSGCSSLNYIKAMFTTTPDSSYTDDWVSGVASTGTFVKNAAATWDVTGDDGVPENWTIET